MPAQQGYSWKMPNDHALQSFICLNPSLDPHSLELTLKADSLTLFL